MIEKINNEKFQTPPDICKYMVSMIPKNTVTVLEPTSGSGHILQALNDTHRFFKIDAPTNIFEHLSTNKDMYDCIVMNPPFSSKYAYGVPDSIKENGMRLGYYILTECLNRTKHCIALMPWFTISDSDVRLRYLKNYGLKSITALPRKTFQYARIQTVVLELDNQYAGDTIFKTLYNESI